MSWISNAPVQINVGRDVKIYNAAAATAMPERVPPGGRSAPVAGERSRLRVGLRFFISGAWFATKLTFWLGVALLVLAPVSAAGLLSLSLWLLGRGAQAVLWIECKCGGGPRHLAYLPALPQRDLPPGEVTLVADGRNSLDVELLSENVRQRCRSSCDEGVSHVPA